jgi:hypothetical protein
VFFVAINFCFGSAAPGSFVANPLFQYSKGFNVFELKISRHRKMRQSFRRSETHGVYMKIRRQKHYFTGQVSILSSAVWFCVWGQAGSTVLLSPFATDFETLVDTDGT